jgi:murein L,D-transpeptidase YafK
MIKDLFGSNNHRTATTSHVVVSGTTAAIPDTTAPASSTAAVSTKPVVVAAIDTSKVATQAAASHNPTEIVIAIVNDWAKAWSSKDSKTYLGFYAKEFKTPDGEERNAWEKQRQDRIAAPKSIKVEISDAKVKLTDDSHATVNFRQHYQASHLNTSSHKTLLLVKSNDKWLIVEEHAGS